MAKEVDWEAIERAYRPGVLSLREIAREHGVSDTAIRKRAKAEGWVRDLVEKVKARTKDKLVRSLGSQGGSHEQQVRTDEEIVEAASTTQASVVQIHRRDIATGRKLVSVLFGELMESTENRHEIEEAIEEEVEDDAPAAKAKRRAAMQKAVSLPSRAAAALSLAGAMKHLVFLERQAFSIDGNADDGDVPASVKVKVVDASEPDANT
jgi:hypothetical protein